MQSGVANVGRGLDVIVGTVIGFTIEHRLGDGLSLVFRNVELGARSEGLQGGRRARCNAAHEGEGAPESQPLTARVFAFALDDLSAIIEHLEKERLVAPIQTIVLLQAFVLGEGSLLAFPCVNIDAAALHEMGGEPQTQPLTLVR